MVTVKTVSMVTVTPAMRAADLNILAFDTVTEVCSVALLSRGRVTQRREAGARHSRRALGMAEEVMRAAGAELRDLDALAVDVGPGAFTGARLGIGIAQGLAYGAGLPVAAVNSLAALAEDVLRPGDGDSAGDGDGLPRHPRSPSPRHPRSPSPRHPRSPLSGGGDGNSGDNDSGGAGGDGLPRHSRSLPPRHPRSLLSGGDAALVLPAIDARMGQVYFALHNAAGEFAGPALAAPGEVGDALASAVADANIIGAGSGWDQYAPKLQESLAAVKSSATLESPTVKWLPGRHPQAAAVARIAAARGLQHAVDPLHLRAIYIRNQVAKPAT